MNLMAANHRQDLQKFRDSHGCFPSIAFRQHMHLILASPLRLSSLKASQKSLPHRFLQTMMIRNKGPEAANRFLDFVNASPTPFHAVRQAAIRLEKAGFQKVCMKETVPFC